jgi:hypothetical protein
MCARPRRGALAATASTRRIRGATWCLTWCASTCKPGLPARSGLSGKPPDTVIREADPPAALAGPADAAGRSTPAGTPALGRCTCTFTASPPRMCPRSSPASTTTATGASTNCAQARVDGGEDRQARAFHMRAARLGRECSTAWGMPRSNKTYPAFRSSARCATRSTNGASSRPGRCTAPGRAAGTRTIGSRQPRPGHRGSQITNGPCEGTNGNRPPGLCV